MGNGDLAGAIAAGDELLGELKGAPARRETAATMGRLAKVRYTHEALIDLIIAQPTLTQNQLAGHFGYTPGWISNILASDSFQVAMAKRREEIIDPTIKATIEERFKALVIRSQEVLMEKLSAPQVSDNVALRAFELGARALGVGGNAPPAPVQPSADRLIRLAERLVDLQANVRLGRTYNGQGISQDFVERDGEGIPIGGLRELQGPGLGGDESAERAGAAEAHAGGSGAAAEAHGGV